MRAAILAIFSMLLAWPAAAQQQSWIWYGASSGPIAPVTTNNPLPVSLGPWPSPAATASIVPSVAGSAVSSVVICTAACNLYDAYVTAGATDGWAMVFNAVAAPANGATTAGIASGAMQHCIKVPATTTQSLISGGAPPDRFSVGATLVFSSTSCATLTLSATAFLHGRGVQ